MKKSLLLILFLVIYSTSRAQGDLPLGAWYMYFGNIRLADSPWAIHIEGQYRDNKLLGDLEQALGRTGLQYNLKSGQVSFLAGYASITTGTLGESSETFHENRVYQEVILRQKLGRVGLNHRYRYEQRWIGESDLRTRFRYAIIVNIPLTARELSEKGSVYLQMMDEIFINGEKPSANIEFFDRNRIYLGLGYRTSTQLAMQIGFLEQTSNVLSKSQLQFSLFHQLTLKK